eukprot:1159435-Pelagomonas_calceolata.AAC.1
MHAGILLTEENADPEVISSMPTLMVRRLKQYPIIRPKRRQSTPQNPNPASSFALLYARAIYSRCLSSALR